MAQLSVPNPERPPYRPVTTGRQRFSEWMANVGIGWLFLIPSLLFFIGWQILPIVRVAWFSLLDYRPIQASRPVTFIGLDNYAQAYGAAQPSQAWHLHNNILREELVSRGVYIPAFLP